MSLGTALNADTPRALWAAGADERVDDGLAVGLRTPAEVRRLADDGRARFFFDISEHADGERRGPVSI